MGKQKQRNRRARIVVRMFTEEGRSPGKSDLADTVRRALRGALSNDENLALNGFIARRFVARKKREAELAGPPGTRASCFVSQVKAREINYSSYVSHTGCNECDDCADCANAPLKADALVPITLKTEVAVFAMGKNGIHPGTKKYAQYNIEPITPSCNYLTDGLARSSLCSECPAARVCLGFDEIPF